MSNLNLVNVSFNSELVEKYIELKEKYESVRVKSNGNGFHYAMFQNETSSKEEFVLLSQMQAVQIELLQSQVSQLESFINNN